MYNLFKLKHRIIIDTVQLNKAHQELINKAPSKYKNTINTAHKILNDTKLRKEYREKGREMEVTDQFNWEEVDAIQVEFYQEKVPTSQPPTTANATVDHTLTDLTVMPVNEKYGEIIYHRVRHRAGKTELKFQVNVIGLELLDPVWAPLDELLIFGRTSLIEYLKMLKRDHKRQYRNLILQFNQLNPFLPAVNNDGTNATVGQTQLI